MHSLQRRLHIGLAASLILLMAGLFWLVNISMQRLAEEFVISRLSHDTDSLVSALQFDADGIPSLDTNHIDSIYKRPFSGHYYIIRFFDGQLMRSRSLWDQELPVEPLAVGSKARWQTDGPNEQQLLVWAAGFRKQGQDFTVAVSEDLTPLIERLYSLNWYFAGLSCFVLLLLLVVQRGVVRSSFRSVRRVQEDVARLEQGDIGQLPEEVPLEIQPLVQEINRLLRLLGQRLKRSRNAVGNLAHALKTPLNLLVQFAEREELRRYPELTGELSQYTERIRQLIERELKRARFAGAGTPGSHFDAAEELPVLIDVLQKVHRDRSVTIDYQLCGQTVLKIDRNDMLELLGNLLDNACKWACHRVLCVLENDNRIRLTVEDDGPGCSDQEMQRLAKRGIRIDESVAGHGLGLSIVRDIVELYDGEMNIDRSPALGGLRVEIVLRSASAV